ncbi:hypothetical protein [Amycolatopsis sp. 195334CR]|uniref:hypothetical protein n=1 Tax=Amycolatopsis sp. 195334CR TaxID=2814588 RepID=UPI001A8CB2BF|nr:hypothetical protein [Amycolatopsis sp. 195334CR]MBN6034072.1 hypothetical protein [Amycolatopsis sp. 195334CR]
MATLGIFMVLIALAFSDEFLSIFLQVGSLSSIGSDWVLIGVDAGLLAIILLVKALFRRRIKGNRSRRDIWTWWFVGAALTLALDLATALFPGHLYQVERARVPGEPPNKDGIPVWFDLMANLAFTIGLALVLMATLHASPSLVFSRKRREGNKEEVRRLCATIPLLVGTLVAYFATTWWQQDLDDPPTTSGCPCDQPTLIDQEFFAQMSQVLALLIVALGIEVGFFRRFISDTGRAPIAVFAISTLCIGDILALSALVKPIEYLQSWHVYAAFILSIEACAVAFCTVIWVLTSRHAKENEEFHPLIRNVAINQVPTAPTPEPPGKTDTALRIGAWFAATIAATAWVVHSVIRRHRP